MPRFALLMTLRKTLLAALLALTALAGCQKEAAAPTPDYLVFGWYHGECQGEACIDIFRLDKAAAQLSEDTTDRYPSATAPYDGQYARKTPAQYQLVQTLPQLVPAQLLTQPVGIIGQPDFADGGGYYVEINDRGRRRFWLIDRRKDNIPTYLHAFADELSTRIQALQ
jgi:hypothetical protein